MPDGSPAGGPVLGPVLGFDTSAAHCAAAVVQDGTVLAERTEPMTRGQAERLLPLAAALLAETGVSWRDLAAIGVGTGPGNFTGTRVAVAAARGLALGLRIPAVGVSATEAAAWDVPRPCRAVVPLRGDAVAWQDFAAGGAGGVSNRGKGDVTVSAPSDDTDAAAGPRGGLRDALPPGPPPLVPRWPVAVAIALAAASAARTGSTPPRPAPVYLRPADAAPPREVPPEIIP